MQWNLIRLRKERNETQEDLARLLHISTEGYRKKENGINQFKSDEMFELANHFDLEINDIFYQQSTQNANKPHRRW